MLSTPGQLVCNLSFVMTLRPNITQPDEEYWAFNFAFALQWKHLHKKAPHRPSPAEAV